MAKAVLVQRVFDDPIVVAVNNFGPINIAQDYSWRTSGILIRRDSTWNEGTLVINLNGYTLTYGAGVLGQQDIRTYAGTRSGDNIAHHVILCPQFNNQNKEYFQQTPDGYFASNTVNNLTVQVNGPGVMRSGSGDGLAFSDAIMLTGPGLSNVDGVTIDVDAPDSMGIRLRNGEIQNNIIHIARQSVTNRGQNPAAIEVEDGSSPTRIHHNTIQESLHVGVKAQDNIEVDNNNITINAASETNAYGIMAYNASGGDWHDNVIRADDHGRGIQIDGGGVDTADNDIDVQGNSDAFLTHGYQVETATSCTSRRDTVVSRASVNNIADGLNLKGILSTSAIDIQDGSFSAYKSAQKHAVAVSFYDTDGTSSTIKNNTFTSDSYLIGSRYGGDAHNWTLEDCTFVLTGGGSTFWVCDQATANDGFVLLDCTFTDCDPRDMESGIYDGDADWTAAVKWTITLSGTAGAAFTCVDANTVTQASGNLDGGGSATVELPEVSLKWDGGTKTTDHTEHNNYTITINGKGQAVTVDAVKTVTEPP